MDNLAPSVGLLFPEEIEGLCLMAFEALSSWAVSRCASEG